MYRDWEFVGTLDTVLLEIIYATLDMDVDLYSSMSIGELIILSIIINSVNSAHDDF